MTEYMPSVLSTKPLNKKQINYALENGFKLTAKKFITIKPLLSPTQKASLKSLFAQKITTIFTSTNAVKQVLPLFDKKYPLNWKTFCIKGKTQTALLNYLPAASIIGIGKNGSELAAKIIAQPLAQPLFFFCSKKRRPLLPKMLNDNHIDFTEIITYDTLPQPSIIQHVYDTIMFYSPSGVKSFFSVNEVTENTVLMAIGSTTAKALRNFVGDKNKILIANFPSPENMIKKIYQFYKPFKT